MRSHARAVVAALCVLAATSGRPALSADACRLFDLAARRARDRLQARVVDIVHERDTVADRLAGVERTRRRLASIAEDDKAGLVERLLADSDAQTRLTLAEAMRRRLLELREAGDAGAGLIQRLEAVGARLTACADPAPALADAAATFDALAAFEQARTRANAAFEFAEIASSAQALRHAVFAMQHTLERSDLPEDVRQHLKADIATYRARLAPLAERLETLPASGGADAEAAPASAGRGVLTEALARDFAAAYDVRRQVSREAVQGRIAAVTKDIDQERDAQAALTPLRDGGPTPQAAKASEELEQSRRRMAAAQRRLDALLAERARLDAGADGHVPQP